MMHYQPRSPFWLRRYALDVSESHRLALLSEETRTALLADVEGWREQHGLPAPSSPLVRGYLVDLLTQVEAQAS